MGIFGQLFGDPWYYFYLLIAGWFLSIFNIPLARTREDDIIHVNLGGCMLPLLLVAHFFLKFLALLDIITLAIGIILMIILSRIVSFYVRGKGVLIVAIVIELISAYLACFFNVEILARLVFGYIISTLGVLIGGDLLHIHKIGSDGRWGDKLSIGGAGTKDGIWTIGIGTMFFIVVVGGFFGW